RRSALLVATCVRSLRVAVGPPYVTRLIVAMAVDTVKRVRGVGASSDVVKEGLETGLPFLAHRDSARPVELKGRVLRIKAAGFRILPRAVLLGTVVVVAHGFPMRAEARADDLSMKASATLRVTALECGSLNLALLPAIALNQPIDTSHTA